MSQKRIPISAARNIAHEHKCRQVIVMAWDGELTHIVTFGKSTEDCAQAAAGGNMLKERWGWPECNDQPSRVKKLEAALKAIAGDPLIGNETLNPAALWYRGIASKALETNERAASPPVAGTGK